MFKNLRGVKVSEKYGFFSPASREHDYEGANLDQCRQRDSVFQPSHPDSSPLHSISALYDVREKPVHSSFRAPALSSDFGRCEGQWCTPSLTL